MATIKRFEEIEAWINARKLTKMIYELTNSSLFSKDYGLKDQIRRSAISVMSNIAEGFESHTQAMFADYLGRAKGSAGELRSQLYISLDCGYIREDDFNHAFSFAEQISEQLYRLIAYLKTQPNIRRVKEDIIEYNIQS
jgi:four helix bundle protein